MKMKDSEGASQGLPRVRLGGASRSRRLPHLGPPPETHRENFRGATSRANQKPCAIGSSTTPLPPSPGDQIAAIASRRVFP